MDKFDKLQRIPLDIYEECRYPESKEFVNDIITSFYNYSHNAISAVDATLMDLAHYMNQNGMDKFVAMLCGLLFEIEHQDVEPDMAYGTNYDINDFETGEYDDLFTSEDLQLIKADIHTIKNYLSKHPELLEEE